MGRTWLLIAPLKQTVSPHLLFSKGRQSRQDTYDAVEEAVAAVAAVASVLRLTGTLLSDCVKANGVWDLNGRVWPTALRALAAWRLRSMVRVGKKKKKRLTTESEVGDGGVRWDRDIERLGGASLMSHVSPWGRSTPPLRESEDGNRGVCGPWAGAIWFSIATR